MEEKGYKPKITAIDMGDYKPYKEFGWFNKQTKTVTPIRQLALLEETERCQMFAMDIITLAVEAGVIVDAEDIPDVFASEDDLDAWLEQLSEFEDWWVNDRHFQAMLHVTGSSEGELRTYPEMAQHLEEVLK